MVAMVNPKPDSDLSRRSCLRTGRFRCARACWILCILKALSASEWYGYALVKALVAVPGVGVAEGSIYPLLSRLKRQGLVTTRLEESREGPARKYYAATPEGRSLAREMELYFGEMQRGFEGLQTRGDFTGPSSGERALPETNQSSS